ncbi:unnamed protein product [Linum trigynum]|uniref:CCHC-type domain-containing protein n=1 Tax=Linum trigynum TaxID=586398 RepID=A0AAV2G981_9ROSI
MLSADGQASPPPPAMALELSGRPPDESKISLQGNEAATPATVSQPLNFKAVLAGNTQETSRRSTQWTFVGSNDIETGTFQGVPELKLSANLKERLCQPWRRTLIIRLLGRSVNYNFLCSQLRRLWRPTGSLEIMDLNNDTFLTTFGSDQDYLRALTGGPWVILDHYLVVHQWSPNFRTSDKPHRSVVAWVQFPELPVHYYHREVLFAIGNLVGRTVKLDYHTENLERGKFARIAIELDMSKPLPTRIRLDGAWQGVLYENLPTICYACGRIGHLDEGCPSRNPIPLKALPMATDQDHNAHPTGESPEIPSGYGPWMQVVRKGRKQIRKFESTQAQSQGANKGRKQEAGRDLGANKGRGASESAKDIMETKGRHEQKLGAKQVKQGVNKGKSVDEGAGANGNKNTNGSKEWRPVGPKERGETSSNNEKGFFKPGPTTKAAMDNQPDPASKSTNEQQPESLPTVLVTGPNKTKIQILEVPELSLPQKENQNPNTSSSSIRQHFPRQKTERSTQHKGVNLRALKKPLQIQSPGKKEVHQKQKQGVFPISIQAIEEFCTPSHKKSDRFSGPLDIEKGDVAMVERSIMETSKEQSHAGGQEASTHEAT